MRRGLGLQQTQPGQCVGPALHLNGVDALAAALMPSLRQPPTFHLEFLCPIDHLYCKSRTCGAKAGGEFKGWQPDFVGHKSSKEFEDEARARCATNNNP
jgi:hypothetical protein